MFILIDNYDSFTYNLFHYLGELGARLEVHRNDKITVDEVMAKHPQGIILSPGPCTPDTAGICLELIKRAAAGADEDEETEHGLPAFALGARSLSRVSAGVLTAAPPAPPDGSAALYEELRSARAQAGLAVDMTLTEFQNLLLSREQEILRARPGARVRFEIGVRQGKPVVIPKVGRRP